MLDFEKWKNQKQKKNSTHVHMYVYMNAADVTRNCMPIQGKYFILNMSFIRYTDKNNKSLDNWVPPMKLRFHRTRPNDNSDYLKIEIPAEKEQLLPFIQWSNSWQKSKKGPKCRNKIFDFLGPQLSNRRVLFCKITETDG